MGGWEGFDHEPSGASVEKCLGARRQIREPEEALCEAAEWGSSGVCSGSLWVTGA